MYKSSAGEDDFVLRYKEAAKVLIKVHEKDHLRERLIEGGSYRGEKSEIRATLAELLALPEYKPDFRIDGHETFGKIVDWIDSSSGQHNKAGILIASCYVDQLKNNQIPNVDYSRLDPRGVNNPDLYLLKLPELTRGQFVAVARNCYQTLVSKN